MSILPFYWASIRSKVEEVLLLNAYTMRRLMFCFGQNLDLTVDCR